MLSRALRTAAFLALAAVAAVALSERPAQAQTAQTVQPGWQYIPSGVSAGQSFRLLFVTSTTTTASSTSISTYNSFVQGRAAKNTHLAGFSGQFRALISTQTVDARDNTATRSTDTDVPIYWLGGAKVADDYADFYDGSWDSGAAKSETGGSALSQFWFGSNTDGTKHASDYLGASSVRIGLINVRNEVLFNRLNPVSTIGVAALSPVIRVDTGKPRVSLSLGATRIDESGSNNSTTLKATLSKAVSSAVTVTLTASPSGKVRLSGTTLTIAASATQSGTVTVTAVDNSADAPDASVRISGTVSGADVDAPNAVTLTVTDDDAEPLPANPPPKTDLLRATASSDGLGNVRLLWNRVYDDTITHFQVSWRKASDSGDSWRNVEDSDAYTIAHWVTGLEKGVEYVFRVRAVNRRAPGPASKELRATPKWPGDSVVAHGIRVAFFGAKSGDDWLALQWRVLSGPPACGFAIELRESGATGDWVRRQLTTAGDRALAKYTFGELKSGTGYDVRVLVKSGYENVAPKLVWERTVTTTGTAGAMQLGPEPETVGSSMRAPRAPEGLTATAKGRTAVTLSWTPPRWSGEAAVKAYEVRHGAAGGDWGGWTATGSRSTRHEVGGLSAGTSYRFEVRATSRVGPGAVSNEATATTEGPSSAQQQPPPEPVAPLTARVSKAPSEHGGGAFAVRIRFSEAVETRAKDAGFQVSGGTVAKARRVNGRRDLWQLEVTPSGHGAVTLTLPAGSVRTADGRTLSDAATVTVAGPPALSVADASAQEAAGATMDFAVTLSRAASGKVTVRYATRNGTAKNGKDYTRAKGRLVFAAGETSKTVSVSVLDDVHDEGTETFRLVLHDAKGAVIADGEAVGTIANADPLQQDWLARFGRAAASDAIAAVTARLETPRDAGSHLTLAGQRVDLSDTDGGAALEQALTGFALLLGASPEAADPAGTGSPKRWLSDIGPADRAGGEARTIRGRELLMGTSFRAVLPGGAGAQWTSWGQGASVSAFSSAGPGLSLSGETATGSLGMDYERGRLLTGFAMTHSLGEGTAQGSGRSYLMGSSVTTMLPYVRYALSERLSAWGLAGTGTGKLTLDLDGAAAERYGADLAMTLAAVGVRGDLVKPVEAGGFALALKADAFWVRTESDSVSKPGVGNLAAARADASRLRAALDGSRTFALAGGRTLSPSVELGLRQDGGDAETGTGFELGAGLGYADPARGLDMALKVHGLAAHAEDGYDEWGVSGSLRLVPGGGGRGLSASLTPSYGVDPGGSERLWAMPDASGLAANENAPLSRRLDAEVGYGMAMFGGGFTGTPNVGMGLSDTARELRLGWRLAPADGENFELHLDASRREAVNDDEPEHRVGFGLTARW